MRDYFVVFFGGPEIGDLRHAASELGVDAFTLDLLDGGWHHDLLRPEVFEPLLKLVSDGAFDVVWLSPPLALPSRCSTCAGRSNECAREGSHSECMVWERVRARTLTCSFCSLSERRRWRVRRSLWDRHKSLRAHAASPRAGLPPSASSTFGNLPGRRTGPSSPSPVASSRPAGASLARAR